MWGDFGHLTKSRKYPIEILIAMQHHFFLILKVANILTVRSAKVGTSLLIMEKINVDRSKINKGNFEGCFKGYFLKLKPYKN